MGDWYRELFDQRYLLFFEDLVQQGAALEEIDFIDQSLALAAGSRILDLGCGFGRHAIPLAERGYAVTGLDLSQDLLDVARQLGERLRVHVDWLQRDMRDLSGLEAFDGCVCLYTAFGYFADDENLAVLRAVRDVLAPEGRLLLHVNNSLALVPHLPEESWSEGPRGVRRESHRYDAMTGRVISDRTLYANQGERLSLPTSSVRLYAPHELGQMLREAGFEIEQVHGGLRGESLRWQHSRMPAWIARRR